MKMFMWFQRLNLTQLLFPGLEAAVYSVVLTILFRTFKNSDTARDFCKMFVSLGAK